MNLALSISVVLLCLGMSSISTGNNLKAFPPAETGMVRHVLQLPEKENESTFKVELIVGRTIEIDEHNQYFFGGKIEEETIAGWGFTRYVVRELGPLGGTLMAIDPTSPPVKRFIPLRGEPYLIRYNSKLPVVLYLPEGVEVRYKIWTTTSDSQPIDQG
ncbi:MAG: proteinase inhibitor I4 serpin [Kiritimatiellaceae bacterium]|nr:proteinase inhibitor I4 serpin [Kiritimatiellaceae bacterium]